MFKFNNTHIFTGYIKQKLSSVNIPTCKIYTQEFADHLARYGKEDSRIVESTDSVVYDAKDKRLATRVNYLKNNELYCYYADYNSRIDDLEHKKATWKRVSSVFYDSEKNIPGLTKTLHSPGRFYDKVTHEYLGEYLRFLRDYYNINLMSLYNCFNDTICDNIYFKPGEFNSKSSYSELTNVVFDSQDPKYKIYAIPAKLFANYTVAIDSYQGIELFCGLYNTHLELSEKTIELCAKTYKKINKAIFNQPILYDKLDETNWGYERELVSEAESGEYRINTEVISRADILNREKDLKIFIKVPATSKSSIVILEGDYRNYNKALYSPSSCLKMSGCSVGSTINLEGYTTKRPQGYKLDNWEFFGYEFESGENKLTVTSEKVPSTELIEDSANITLWTQGALEKPKFSETSGYCEIATAEELAYVIVNGGATKVNINGEEKIVRRYRILNDIYLNDPHKIDWDTGEARDEHYQIRTWYQHIAEVSQMNAFSGIIEGDGNTIYGLYLNNAKASNSTALIPLIDREALTTINNLGINYAFLHSTNVDAFVSNASAANIKHDIWSYEQNRSILNFGSDYDKVKIDNNSLFSKPISRLQLLEFNTGESYPFADRLIEYLSGSAITPIDEIYDNIKRTQRVMKNNQHYFKIEGLWENKIQKIIYDYIMNSGPVEIVDGKPVDKRRGYHSGLGHTHKSTTYDILGYVDKDAEKWYASWQKLEDKDKNETKVTAHDTIQNVDIYDGLYDI